MANSSVVARAEQRPMAPPPDLPFDRTLLRGGSLSASRGRRDLVFVVNPRGWSLSVRARAKVEIFIRFLLYDGVD